MADRRTPTDLINASGVLMLPEYTGVVRFIDGPGFSVKRDYPPDTDLSRVLTRRGHADACCLIHFAVSPSRAPGGVLKLTFSTRLVSRWGENRAPGQYDFADPDCPTRESLHVLARAPKPVALMFRHTGFIYDPATGWFYAEEGQPVTGKQILDYLYDYHCRTLHWRFRMRTRLRKTYAHAVGQLLNGVHRAAAWLLEHGYDNQATIPPGDPRFRSTPYSFADFRRVPEDPGTHFFGLASSKRSLFSTILLLCATCLAVYKYLPRTGFFRGVYHNVPLTTAALALALLALDQTVPFVLKAIVCGVSRLRPMTPGSTRKVKA
jgi:hypothetical protein